MAQATSACSWWRIIDSTREVLARILRRAGHHVDAAATGAEALASRRLRPARSMLSSAISACPIKAASS